MRITIWALLVLAAPLASQGHGGARAGPDVTLTGTVTDATSGAPISGAEVRLRDRDRVVSTGADGGFELRVPSGPVALAFDRPGYVPLAFTQLAGPGTPPIRVGLRPRSPSRPIVVNDHRAGDRRHIGRAPVHDPAAHNQASLLCEPVSYRARSPCFPWLFLFGVDAAATPPPPRPEGRLAPGYPVDPVRNMALRSRPLSLPWRRR